MIYKRMQARASFYIWVPDCPKIHLIEAMYSGFTFHQSPNDFHCSLDLIINIVVKTFI